MNETKNLPSFQQPELYQNDMVGAAMSLGVLQDSYQLNASDLAKGVIFGENTDSGNHYCEMLKTKPPALTKNYLF